MYDNILWEHVYEIIPSICWTLLTPWKADNYLKCWEWSIQKRSRAGFCSYKLLNYFLFHLILVIQQHFCCLVFSSYLGAKLYNTCRQNGRTTTNSIHVKKYVRIKIIYKNKKYIIILCSSSYNFGSVVTV